MNRSPSNVDDEQASFDRVKNDLAAGSEACKADTRTSLGTYADDMVMIRAFWDQRERKRKAAELKAKKLEDAFVAGKNCTTKKQMEEARTEYRKQLRILSWQGAAEKVLKVRFIIFNLNSALIRYQNSELCVPVSGQERRHEFMAKIRRQGPFLYDPIENVRKLLSRKEWGLEEFPHLLQEIPELFVSTFFNLEGDPYSESGCSFVYPSDRNKMFGYSERTAYHAVKEIVQAIYPVLKCKELKVFLHEDWHSESSRRVPRADLYWCRNDGSTAQLIMEYSELETWDTFLQKRFVTHSFHFQANSAWVDQRTEDRRILEAGIMQDRMLAFAMGLHDRVGGRSQLRILNSDMLRTIARLQ